MRLPKIEFITPHGSYELHYNNAEQTLNELCLANKLPPEFMTFYGISGDDKWLMFTQM